VSAERKPLRRACIALLGAAVAFCAAAVIHERIFGDILSNIPFSRAYTDRDGNLLRVFLASDGQYRIRSRLADYSPEFVEALLLQEDRFFYAHPGVNPAALWRAAYETWIRKSRRMGASTITMQVARLAYGIRTDTVPGKLRQIASALLLEVCNPKNRILEAYLNLAPVGGNLEGFQTGAWYYFGKNAARLELSQSLLLAVLPQDPVARAPRAGVVPEETLAARSVLFESWLSDHPEDGDKRADLALAVRARCSFPFVAPHFTERARSADASPAAGSKARGERRTTLDGQLQDIAENALRRWLERNRSLGVTNGAALVADRKTMEIRASIGSASWFDESIYGQVDGTLAKRSPGSALKPFIYALALDAGLIHSATVLKDTPTGFNEYTPDNFRSDFSGPVSAQKALTDSRNIPAIALERDLISGKGAVQTDDLYGLLSRAKIGGLKDRDHYGLSLVLGSAEVSMDELAGLYGALGNGGRFRNPTVFPERSDTAPASATELFSDRAAFIALKMLESNELPPSSRSRTSSDIPIAYKTGTSVGFKDAWSAAVAGPFVVVVWIGNFDGQGNTAFLGRTMAAPLLIDIVDASLATLPGESRAFPETVPEGVTRVAVCPVSGALPGPDCPKTESAWYIPGVSPIDTCKIHRAVYIDTRTGYRTDRAAGPNIVRQVREFWPSDILALFAEAGLPRLLPPPYEPGNLPQDSRLRGFPPDIVSPLSNATYVIRAAGQERNTLVFHASADADTAELFWFADSIFVGRAKPGAKAFWNPSPGIHLITAVDERGRSSSVTIKVVSEE